MLPRGVTACSGRRHGSRGGDRGSLQGWGRGSRPRVCSDTQERPGPPLHRPPLLPQTAHACVVTVINIWTPGADANPTSEITSGLARTWQLSRLPRPHNLWNSFLLTGCHLDLPSALSRSSRLDPPNTLRGVGSLLGFPTLQTMQTHTALSTLVRIGLQGGTGGEACTRGTGQLVSTTGPGLDQGCLGPPRWAPFAPQPLVLSLLYLGIAHCQHADVGSADRKPRIPSYSHAVEPSWSRPHASRAKGQRCTAPGCGQCPRPPPYRTCPQWPDFPARLSLGILPTPPPRSLPVPLTSGAQSPHWRACGCRLCSPVLTPTPWPVTARSQGRPHWTETPGRREHVSCRGRGRSLCLWIDGRTLTPS